MALSESEVSVNSDSEWSELSASSEDEEKIHVQKLRAKLAAMCEQIASTRLDEFSESEDESKQLCSLRSNVCKMSSRNHSWEPIMFENVRVEKIRLAFSEPLHPFDYFRQYFPERVFNRFAHFTHIYATRDVANTTTRSWKSPSIVEIRQLFGIHAIMGALKFPRTRLYWNTKYSLRAVSSVMPIKRFLALRSNLHIVRTVDENKDDENYLWKVQPLIDKIRNVMRSFTRDQHLTIDEQIIPFKAKCRSKKKVTLNKPNRIGFVNYVLANNKGLVLDFEILQGRNTPISSTDKACLGFSGAIVLRLTETIPSDFTHFLYFDRFFTSIKLLEKLLERKLFATGTAASHKLCDISFTKDEDFSKQNIRGGFEQFVRSDTRMTAVKWLDKKPVTLISTCIGVQPFSEVSRWSKNEKKLVAIDQPLIVRKYNEYGIGVDLHAQLMAMYRTKIRTKKWTLRMVFYLFDMSICNAWTQYREDMIANKSQKILDLLDFKLLVGETLCTAAERGARRPPTSRDDDSPTKVDAQTIASRLVRENGKHLAVFDDDASHQQCKHCVS